MRSNYLVNWTSICHIALILENERVDGVTFPSPVWAKRVAGTKHGAWDAYFDAREHAENLADLALMVHEYCIVDADRCTPLIPDEDGDLAQQLTEFR